MVDEAHKLERKAAAHAHGTEGIKIATPAGVASIEHASFLDEEGAMLIRQNGTFLVPTLVAGAGVERFARSGVLKGLRAEKALAAAAAMREDKTRSGQSRADSAWHRCRSHHSRNQYARVPAHGGVGRIVTDCYIERGDNERSETSCRRTGLEQSRRGSSLTLSPCPAIRSRTFMSASRFRS